MNAASAKPTITAVILTTNSERLLEQCLDSVHFCDSILVVDGGSVDSTLSIAKAHGAHVLSRTWDIYENQCLFALSHVSTDWVFVLDSDEICSPALQDAILRAVQTAPPTVQGFYVRRCTWYLNRFMLHGNWYPDRLPRCFRNGAGTVETSYGSHAILGIQGATERIEADIFHYTYDSYFTQLQKLNIYAQVGAEDLRAKGRKGGLCRALFHSIWRFIAQYVMRLGFLDGKAGFILATHEAFYVFCKYIRVEEHTWGAPFNYEKKDKTLPKT